MFKSKPTTIEGFFITGGSKLYGFCWTSEAWDNCWTDQDKDSFLHKWDNRLTYQDEDNFRHNLLRNYYIDSTKNDRTDRPWWTSYENHFIGDAIIIIERKDSKIDGIFTIQDCDSSITGSGLELNKYDLLINNIFADKNSIDTLKERTEKAIKIRDLQIGDFIELTIQEILNYSKKRNFDLGYYLIRKREFFTFLGLFLLNMDCDLKFVNNLKINKMKRWLDKVRHIYLSIILVIIIYYIRIKQIGNELNITTIIIGIKKLIFTIIVFIDYIWICLNLSWDRNTFTGSKNIINILQKWSDREGIM
tara:strand:+ start:1001 stop:1915 length:915 start_codon:yes stop_codon:yes gene_type:complete